VVTGLYTILIQWPCLRCSAHPASGSGRRFATAAIMAAGLAGLATTARRSMWLMPNPGAPGSRSSDPCPYYPSGFIADFLSRTVLIGS